MVPLLLILAVTVTMFRIGDPCCLLLLCLLAGLGWKRPCFRLSGIDVALVCICLYDAVDYDDEGPGRPADLHRIPAEERDDEASYDGRNETFFRGHSR